MKWINHLAIAGATTALVSPALVPVALLGSTAPDWLEWVLEKFGHRVRHRTLTHIMLYWIGALVFALVLWDFHGILAAFAWGGLSHILADSFTVTGVPFSPFSDRRFHLFGGRLRTGGSGETGLLGVLSGSVWCLQCCLSRMAGLGGIRSFLIGAGCIRMAWWMRRSGRITA